MAWYKPKDQWKHVRKEAKDIGRKTAAVQVKINRVVVPVVAAAGTYFGGPIVGEAVTAIGASASYYLRATQARNEGITGRAARSLGRGERKRVAIYSQAGIGLGAISSGVVTALYGGGLGDSLGGALLGQTGKQIVYGGAGMFGTPVANGVGPFGALNPAVSGSQLSSLGAEAPEFGSWSAAGLNQPGTVLTSSAVSGGELAATSTSVYEAALAALAGSTAAKDYWDKLKKDLPGMGGKGGAFPGGGNGGGGGDVPGGGILDWFGKGGQEEAPGKGNGLMVALVIGGLLLASGS